MKKFLFLDFDGVLNSLEFFNSPTPDYRKYPLNEFDPHAVDLLNKILSAGGVTNLVISSDWRKIYSKEELKKILKDIGVISPFFEEFDIIPNFSSCENINYELVGRGVEIDIFLRHFEKYNFCIIDDDFRFLEKQKSKVVLTNFNYGLSKNDVELALDILK